MNANHDLERRLADFYATEAPQRAPDRVLESALADHRHHPTAARGHPPAVEVPDHEQLRQGGDRGGGRDRDRGGRADRAAPGHVARRWRPGRDALARTVTISVAFGVQPTDVVAQPRSAADPELHLDAAWDFDVVPGGMDRSKRRPSPGRTARSPSPSRTPQVDLLYDPTLTTDLFLAIASQPIGDSTPEDWIAAQMASDEGCGTTTEPIAVDGATGLIGVEGCTVAVVTTAGRGYWIQLYTGRAARPSLYDRAWFEEVLATVQLQPEDAVDVAPSASP